MLDDDTRRQLVAEQARGRDLKAVPTSTSTDPERRAWLGALFSLADGFTIGEPVRYGATSSSPMTIPILGPGGDVASTVRFEAEREIGNPQALRGALARDANLRGATITSAKVAGDAYYVLCELAQIVGRADPRSEARAWIDDYQEAAEPIEGHELSRGRAFAAVDALRHFPYSKRAINLHLAAQERGHMSVEPQPPLLIDNRTKRAWTSITHLGTYVRHGRDFAETISDTALAGRVLEHGCQRRALNVWDRSDRKRSKRISIVLIGFPAAPEPPEQDDLDGLDT